VDPQTERALVDRLRRGDPDAFDDIHGAFNARLFTFLLRLSRRREVAQDLLEDTWLRLVKHAPRLRPDTCLGAWLFAVARNLHVSHLRARLLEDSALAGLMTCWPLTTGPASPFEVTAASELEARVERALASLPASSREVLLLVAAGLESAAIAQVLRITPEAFRQRLSRARAALARALDADSPGHAVPLEVTP
jgi:RNA polymerase sigma-70 factor (ECF subfamily)